MSNQSRVKTESDQDRAEVAQQRVRELAEQMQTLRREYHRAQSECRMMFALWAERSRFYAQD